MLKKAISDGLGCLCYLNIRTIFKMANIVTWQERGINLLATKNASKDILNVICLKHLSLELSQLLDNASESILRWILLFLL